MKIGCMWNARTMDCPFCVQYLVFQLKQWIIVAGNCFAQLISDERPHLFFLFDVYERIAVASVDYFNTLLILILKSTNK